MRDCPAGRNLGFCFRFSALTRSEMVSEKVENLICEAGNVKKNRLRRAHRKQHTNDNKPPKIHILEGFYILPPWFPFYPLVFSERILPPRFYPPGSNKKKHYAGEESWCHAGKVWREHTNLIAVFE